MTIEYYCLNVIVNISSFNPFNTNVNTTLKYYRKQALNKNTKTDGRGHKIFYEKASEPRNV